MPVCQGRMCLPRQAPYARALTRAITLGTVPASLLAEYLLPFAVKRFPPHENESDFGFNVTHFAQAINERMGGRRDVMSDRRMVSKVFGPEQLWPRQPILHAICGVLDVPFDSLPGKPTDASRLAELERKVAALEAALTSRPRRAAGGGL